MSCRCRRLPSSNNGLAADIQYSMWFSSRSHSPFSLHNFHSDISCSKELTSLLYANRSLSPSYSPSPSQASLSVSPRSTLSMFSSSSVKSDTATVGISPLTPLLSLRSNINFLSFIRTMSCSACLMRCVRSFRTLAVSYAGILYGCRCSTSGCERARCLSCSGVPAADDACDCEDHDAGATGYGVKGKAHHHSSLRALALLARLAARQTHSSSSVRCTCDTSLGTAAVASSRGGGGVEVLMSCSCSCTCTSFSSYAV